VESGNLKVLLFSSFLYSFTPGPVTKLPISPVQRQRSGRAAASKWEKLSTEYDEKMAGARERV
jgi:hypothetical protein